MRIKEIEVAGNTYEVEWASHLLDHFLGMRGRKEGKMLFKFPYSDRWRIDMMSVLTDLQLYFIDEDMKVVDVKDAEKWRLNPKTWRFYRPKREARYLLESSTPLPIAEGDEIELK